MSERPAWWSFLQDERGSFSWARFLLTLELLYVWTMGYREALGRLEVSGPMWALHASLVIALVSWAGGPRIAQHIGGQVGAVAHGVAQAARRLAKTDNARKDDERG